MKKWTFIIESVMSKKNINLFPNVCESRISCMFHLLFLLHAYYNKINCYTEDIDTIDNKNMEMGRMNTK